MGSPLEKNSKRNEENSKISSSSSKKRLKQKHPLSLSKLKKEILVDTNQLSEKLGKKSQPVKR